jgi:hypothetical protein
MVSKGKGNYITKLTKKNSPFQNDTKNFLQMLYTQTKEVMKGPNETPSLLTLMLFGEGGG